MMSSELPVKFDKCDFSLESSDHLMKSSDYRHGDSKQQMDGTLTTVAHRALSVYPDGAYPDGVWSLYYPRGVHPDGVYPGGVYPDGAYPDGVYPDGAFPADGVHPDGVYTGGVHQPYHSNREGVTSFPAAELVAVDQRSMAISAAISAAVSDERSQAISAKISAAIGSQCSLAISAQLDAERGRQIHGVYPGGVYPADGAYPDGVWSLYYYPD